MTWYNINIKHTYVPSLRSVSNTFIQQDHIKPIGKSYSKAIHNLILFQIFFFYFLFTKYIFLEHQISKTEVMASENSALPSQE